MEECVGKEFLADFRAEPYLAAERAVLRQAEESCRKQYYVP